MVVVAAIEVDGPVVLVAAVLLEVVAIAVAMVAVVIPVVMMVGPGTMLVPLRGGRAGEKHESGGDETCNAKLHRRTISVRGSTQSRPAALNRL